MKYETCRSLLQKLDTLRSNDLRNLANNFVLGTNVDIGETTANYGFLPVAKNEEAEDILVNVRRGEWLTMVPELPFINQVSKKVRVFQSLLVVLNTDPIIHASDTQNHQTTRK